jgi:benzaldehyde dehydrogenase (NAD)
MSRGSRLWQDEIFAPIAPVLVVDDDEAVAVANDTG